MANLTNENEVRLDFDGYLNTGAYIEELNSIVIQKVRVKNLREHSDLWLYNLSTGHEQRVMENAGFAIDSFSRLRE